MTAAPRSPEPTTPTLAILSGGALFTAFVVGMVLVVANMLEVKEFVRVLPDAPYAGLLAWLERLAPVADRLGWATLGTVIMGVVKWLWPRWLARYAPRPARPDEARGRD